MTDIDPFNSFDELLPPSPEVFPAGYTVKNLTGVVEKVKLSNVGWEVRFYKLNPLTIETLKENIWDDPAQLGPENRPNWNYDRWHHGARYVLTRAVRATDIKLMSKLDSPNQATVSVPLGGQPQGIMRDEVAPFNTAMEVSYNGFPMFGGIVWTCRADFTKQVLTVNASSFLSFFAHRTTDHKRKGMDMISALWATTVMVSNRNRGIHSAVKYDAPNPNTLPAKDKKDVIFETGAFNHVLDSIYDYADNDDGFFVYDDTVRQGPANINKVDYKATTLNHVVVFSKNRKPKPLKIDGTVVELKDRENCEIQDLLIDGTTYANVFYAAGNSSTMGGWVPIQKVWADGQENATPGVQQLPVKDLTVKYNVRGKMDKVDQASQDEEVRAQMAFLLDKANHMKTWGSEATVMPRVRVYPHIFHPAWFRQVNQGLTIQLSSRNEYAKVDNEYVILGSTIDVDKDGTPIVDLEMVQRKMFPVAD